MKKQFVCLMSLFITFTVFSQDLSLAQYTGYHDLNFQLDVHYLNIDHIYNNKVLISDLSTIYSLDLLSQEVHPEIFSQYGVVSDPRLNNQMILYTDGYMDSNILILFSKSNTNRYLSRELYQSNLLFQGLTIYDMIREIYWLSDEKFIISMYQNMNNGVHNHDLLCGNINDISYLQLIKANSISSYVDKSTKRFFFIAYNDSRIVLYERIDELNNQLTSFDMPLFIECYFKEFLILKSENKQFYIYNLSNKNFSKLDHNSAMAIRDTGEYLYFFNYDNTIDRYVFR